MNHIDNLVEGKKIILFGASNGGARAVVLDLEGYDIAYFCDNDPNKWGKSFVGIPVMNPKVLSEEDPEQICVIITSMYTYEISKQLINDYGIRSYNVWALRGIALMLKNRYEMLCTYRQELDRVYSLLADDESKQRFNMLLENYNYEAASYANITSGRKQYFNDIFADCMSSEEIYVDAGTYNEESIISFIQFVDNKYKKIYGFEPTPERYGYLSHIFKNASKRISIINAAVSDYNGEAFFKNTIQDTSSNNISPEGDIKVKAVKLDDAIDGPVTFIKMDIEGSEYNAIVGAQNIIKQYKPKLAISIYHRNDDLWRLPLLIHEMVPEYKFFIDHHSDLFTETVLYVKI